MRLTDWLVGALGVGGPGEDERTNERTNDDSVCVWLGSVRLSGPKQTNVDQSTLPQTERGQSINPCLFAAPTKENTQSKPRSSQGKQRIHTHQITNQSINQSINTGTAVCTYYIYGQLYIYIPAPTEYRCGRYILYQYDRIAVWHQADRD